MVHISQLFSISMRATKTFFLREREREESFDFHKTSGAGTLRQTQDVTKLTTKKLATLRGKGPGGLQPLIIAASPLPQPVRLLSIFTTRKPNKAVGKFTSWLQSVKRQFIPQGFLVLAVSQICSTIGWEQRKESLYPPPLPVQILTLLDLSQSFLAPNGR